MIEQKEQNELPEEISSFLAEQTKFEINQERRYYYKNTSIEYLEERHVSVEEIAVAKSKDVFDEAVSENANFGLLDIVGNGELLKALSMLKDIDILILTLKYRYGRTLEEIGAALKKDRSTIGKRHNNAIKVLREWILK